MAENKPLILGVGLSGLVGSRIAEILADSYIFQNLSTDTGVDITKPETLAAITDEENARVVLHLAAKTDVDGCELDKKDGQHGAAWQINVEGARNVANACLQSNKKMVYISTDFVFDGAKSPDAMYNEEDTPNPVNWYAETKYQGEQAVIASGVSNAIIRLAYPYRTPFLAKKDLIQAIKSRLEAGQEVFAVTDHIMCPTYVDDFANAIDMITRNDVTGIFHAVGSQALSPFALAQLIAKTYALDPGLIKETTREVFFKDRAMRPFNLALNNGKIKKLGVSMKTVEEGLKALETSQ